MRSGPQADPGGAIGTIAPLKPKIVTFFTVTIYISENNLTSKMSSKMCAKTINPLCTDNKVFVKYQAKGGF